ncbi:hypothetical protein EDD21DRAFT_413553 [Dissophora ornata]|nr:hypothetical protein EDD21DRAFT_413553 [Dissophora ornata]
MPLDQEQKAEVPASTLEPHQPMHAREEASCMGPYCIPSPPSSPHYLSAVDRSDIPEMLRILNIDDSVFLGTAGFLPSEDPTVTTTTAGANTPQKLQTIAGKEGRTGYWVSPEFRNQAYALRSLRFLLSEIADKEMGYDLVKAEAYVDNSASRKVMENAGMVLESDGKIVRIPNFGGAERKRHS